MTNKIDVQDYLLEYILKLSKGEQTKELFEKYKKYLDSCNAAEVNSAIDKYIDMEDDFDHIERTVAKFIRACERGLESQKPIEFKNPYLKLLLKENSLLEEHKNKTTVIYKEVVEEYCKTKDIDINKLSILKENLLGFKQVVPHYLKLQNSLFPALEDGLENMNCLKLMWHIQDSILSNLKELIKIIDKVPFDFTLFNKIYGDMYLKIGKLLYREETILFPLSVSFLSDEKFHHLLEDVDSLGTAFNVNLQDFYGGKNMSELINNSQQRKEELNKIIKALNEREDSSTVQKEIKRDFKKLLDTLSPEEIAEAEQALIAEGVAVEEVQQLCELHVDTFHEALKNASKRAESGSTSGNEKLSGHPIANYRAENKELKSQISEFKKAYKRLKRKNDFNDFNEALKSISMIEIHYQRKENQLFPFLEEVDFTGPSKVMWGKHDEIRDVFRKLKTAVKEENVGECVSLSKSLIPQLKRMVFMEEKILFPTAIRKLPEDVWATIRKGESEIGYAWIKPGNLWAPEIVSEKKLNFESTPPLKTKTDDDLVDLSVGKLSPSQIDLMLKNLPLDITFVDENDKVRYFSQGKERIFPRSPGIIGRSVENCHPPKSVHVVKKIVNDFKERKRDRAEFWIQMNGSFIYIRYFPLFEKDVYKGVIEVSQEISSIKALEGEKRLLDEE
ncbi:MAG: DUF438 domain-containing protein [Sphaerochaetaceae bacterium]|nr:DUF438 domain-containing protein [Sphaerochaetaceae bacterium]